ncbi:MAG TPA: hypothetical protein VHZ51_07995 [Ktedonobacteraceae bacterium]|nr:hypothetical protein [Ktedonobacteraceae bacterium]
MTSTAVTAQGTTLYTYKGHTSRVNDLAWSPDSTFIVSEDFNTLCVWDATTGQNSFVHQTHGTDRDATLAWSPDGTRIAMSNGPSAGTNPLLILDAKTGATLVSSKGLTNFFFFQLAWSPDSRHVAVAGDRDVEICDASTGQKLLTYPAKRPQTGNQFSYAVAWSPDGSTIASSAASTGHAIQFWDAQSGQPLHYFLGGRPVVLAWSPDGKRIVLRTNSGVQMLDVNTAHVVLSVPGSSPETPQTGGYLPTDIHPHTVAWSPDGKYIAVANGQKQVQVWNVGSQSPVYTYSEHSDVVLAVAWSPDGSRIASASYDKTVRVWQAL